MARRIKLNQVKPPTRASRGRESRPLSAATLRRQLMRNAGYRELYKAVVADLGLRTLGLRL